MTVIDYPDGRLSIRHDGVDLPYRMHYDKIRKVTQAAIVENNRLSEVLAYVAQRQQERDGTADPGVHLDDPWALRGQHQLGVCGTVPKAQSAQRPLGLLGNVDLAGR